MLPPELRRLVDVLNKVQYCHEELSNTHIVRSLKDALKSTPEADESLLEILKKVPALKIKPAEESLAKIQCRWMGTLSKKDNEEA